MRILAYALIAVGAIHVIHYMSATPTTSGVASFDFIPALSVSNTYGSMGTSDILAGSAIALGGLYLAMR